MKAYIKKLLKNIIGLSVAHIPIVRGVRTNGLTVFIFHDISDSSSAFCKKYDLSISIKRYKEIILWIKNNYNIISPETLLVDREYSSNSALITFDDGFYGSFINGLSVLDEMDIPSIFFLNMKPIIEKKPILSAISSYLEDYDHNFIPFCKKKGIRPPYHLSLTPSILGAFESKYGYLNYDAIINYQGRFVDINLLNSMSNSSLVYYANHFYDHWNALVLSEDEFREQYYLNKKMLSTFKNYIDFFAFTNGAPNTAYSSREVKLLKDYNAKKVFSALPVINKNANDTVLNRVSLISEDVNYRYIYYKMLRGEIRSKFLGMNGNNL